jgi:PH (Pleckstrin Homology) domain-containing protein/putative oligomerization/nucleic acid binding protein
MSYLDNVLGTGEDVLRREHQHPFVLVANAVWAIVGWIVAVLLLLLVSGLGDGGVGGFVRSIGGYAVLILVIGGVIWFFWQILVWQNEEFVITNRRVLETGGVLNKEITDSSLEKINDAILKVSVFGRMFGFGDLEILTASEAGISKLRMLRQPDDFKRTMLDAKHDLELELSGARPMPGPAFRTPSVTTMTPVDTAPPAAAPVAAAATPVAAPAAAPVAEQMSADQVTRTLSSLADLRDRGAISAEEYEAKKADLLGRL